jgi:hypothetical protein
VDPPQMLRPVEQESMSTPPNDALTIPRSFLRRLTYFVCIILLLALVAEGAVYLARNVSSNVVAGDSLAASINSNEYQAVFLANGQIYFGRLTAPGGDFYYLRHVYYLQQQQSPQGGKTVRSTLTKLGGEIHGPEDEMVINRSQILFVENLKPSGQVSKVINAARP